jgi:deoxyribose-phosphate aldolase
MQKNIALTAAEMAAHIDHTLLKPDALDEEFERICDEALAYGFKSVCVNSGRVQQIAKRLSGTAIEVCSVVGFPLGAMQSRAKASEAGLAVEAGATELDMVINIGALKSGDSAEVQRDIRAVREAAGRGVVLKVIIETCLLEEHEKILACKLSVDAGADFVKTSTGFSIAGATIKDVALMRRTVGPDIGVKASGGIKDFNTAAAMIATGANRIGAGAGIQIVQGAP